MSGPGGPPRVRNGLGTITFLVVVVGAVLAVLPATAALGMLLCLLSIIPAIIAFVRTRRRRATNRRRAVAALVMAPVFLLVAVGVIGATAPGVLPTYVADTAPVGDSTSSSAQPHAPDPENADVPGVVAAAEPLTESAAPSTAVPPPAGSASAAARAPQQALAAAPLRRSVTTRLPARVDVPSTSAQRAASSATTSERPVAPSRSQTKKASSSCDSATHYVNTDGNCILRPIAAAKAPSGATAKCADGTYSSSQHRQGTCSGHGGVARWLAGAPSS